jgi:hypothetical protein
MKAFPLKAVNKFDDCEGMDLRDYFAAKALPLAMKWIEHNYTREMNGDWSWHSEDEDEREIAEIAYHMADAMMQAREGKG